MKEARKAQGINNAVLSFCDIIFVNLILCQVNALDHS